ncbi:UNVERIFIED_CONTAM: hypothetical protein K2H54_057434 [Gekko kuhli]
MHSGTMVEASQMHQSWSQDSTDSPARHQKTGNSDDGGTASSVANHHQTALVLTGIGAVEISMPNATNVEIDPSGGLLVLTTSQLGGSESILTAISVGQFLSGQKLELSLPKMPRLLFRGTRRQQGFRRGKALSHKATLRWAAFPSHTCGVRVLQALKINVLWGFS